MERPVTELVACFIDRAYSMSGPPRVKRMEAAEMLEMFFAQAGQFKNLAEAGGMAWSNAAVQEVDDLLETIADNGDFEPDWHLSPEGRTEWYYRWAYAVVALTLEAKAKTQFHMFLPADADERIQAMAVVLQLLGGAARDYPPEVFHKS